MPDQLTIYQGTCPYVFISFQNSEQAEPIIRHIQKMGFRVRFPLIIGDKVLFDKKWIKTQIEGCAVFLLLCEPEFYRASPTQWELETAVTAGKKIVRVDLALIPEQTIPQEIRRRLALCPHLKKYEMAEAAFYEALLTDRVLYPCHEDDTVLIINDDAPVPILPPPLPPAVPAPSDAVSRTAPIPPPPVVTKEAQTAQRGARVMALTADGIPKAYEGSEPFIFVSYRHIEKKQAYPIIRRLNEAGYRVWYDEGIRSGEQYWNDVVAEHVKRCTVLIALCSKAFFASEHCREELEYAKKLGHTIHWIDLSRYPEDSIPAGIAMRFNMVQKTARYEMKEDAFYELLFQGRGMDLCRYADAAPQTSAPAAKETAPAKAKPVRRFLQRYGTLLMIVSSILMLVSATELGTSTMTSVAQFLGGICLTAGIIDTIRTLAARRKQIRLGKCLLVILLVDLAILLLLLSLLFAVGNSPLPQASAIMAVLCALLATTARMLCGD